eukprot:TRINITY_DN718_c0_g1_i1.p1 TRINITY_DN718_c0_g1~~TRINITY_DN718_c0_g1_i1.p1  ORF type:complete len:358 (+),score=167.50 TRINITY_DN718_c0_g1_i1:68-1075(+)
MRAVIAEGGKLVVTTRPVPVPQKNEVLVKIKSTAINRADTLQRKGMYAVPPGVTDVLGLEMSGEVVSQGEGSGKWKPGDKVMGLLSGGGYAEYTTLDEGLLLPVPERYSLHEAAGIPETWLTAYQLLHLVGGVQEGESVVIHAAGSGVGTAATQLARQAKATVIATAGAEEKLDVARSLGAAITVDYKKEAPWSEAVKQKLEAAGKGAVNLVLDPVGGPDYAAQNINVLGLDGRWVSYGLMGGASVSTEENPKAPFLGMMLRKRLSLLATTLRTRSLPYRQHLVSEFAKNSLPLFDKEEFKVIIDKKSFTLDDIQAAHDYMESNANIGKILVSVA